MRKLSGKSRATPPTRLAPVVKGPIRCHKCQTKCLDAAEYLSHVCESQGSANEIQTRRFIFSHAGSE